METNTSKKMSKEETKEEKVFNYLKGQTKKFSKANGYMTKKENVKVSEKANQLISIIKAADFGCQLNAVCELVSILSGEEVRIPREYNRIDWSFKGAIIVPLREFSSHDYAQDMPTLCTGYSERLYPRENRSSAGNDLGSVKDSVFIRPAKDKEIRDFIKEISIETIGDKLGIVFL